MIGQMKQNTQKGKGKRIERKRKASLICPWFACSGPPWPFHLGASCLDPPPGITLQAEGGSRGSLDSTVGSVGSPSKSKKRIFLAFPPRSQSAAHEDGADRHPAASCPSLLLRHYCHSKGKICWCNCFAAVAQSSSLNEIDERSGSRCYHKVMITWW